MRKARSLTAPQGGAETPVSWATERTAASSQGQVPSLPRGTERSVAAGIFQSLCSPGIFTGTMSLRGRWQIKTSDLALGHTTSNPRRLRYARIGKWPVSLIDNWSLRLADMLEQTRLR